MVDSPSTILCYHPPYAECNSCSSEDMCGTAYYLHFSLLQPLQQPLCRMWYFKPLHLYSHRVSRLLILHDSRRRLFAIMAYAYTTGLVARHTNAVFSSRYNPVAGTYPGPWKEKVSSQTPVVDSQNAQSRNCASSVGSYDGPVCRMRASERSSRLPG